MVSESWGAGGLSQRICVFWRRAPNKHLPLTDSRHIKRIHVDADEPSKGCDRAEGRRPLVSLLWAAALLRGFGDARDRATGPLTCLGSREKWPTLELKRVTRVERRTGRAETRAGDDDRQRPRESAKWQADLLRERCCQRDACCQPSVGFGVWESRVAKSCFL